MNAFAASWLSLREPVDARSRSAELAALFAAHLPVEPRLVDLGAGTGANLRWLAPRLGRARQHWTLVDADGGLLADAPVSLPPLSVEMRQLDLAGGIDGLGLGGYDGVVTTAFLDLVSASWIDDLVAGLSGQPLLVSLSVDDRLGWEPADPEDGLVRAGFFAHQHRDKGFGPALGPEAATALERRLTAAGYHVERRAADWVLDSGDGRLIDALLAGWASAASEARPEAADRIAAWARRRRAESRAGTLAARVGHQDLAAWQ